MKKILIAVLAVFMVMAGQSHPAYARGAVSVIEKEGRVQVIPAGRKRPEVCMEGMTLDEGSIIRTKEGSSVIIAIDNSGKNIAKVDELSEVVIKIDSAGEIELVEGEIYALLKGMKEGTKFAVRTPSAVCGARGTGWLTSLRDGVTAAEVFDGTIFSQGLGPDGTPKGEEFFTSAGFKRTISEKGNISDQVKLSMQRMKDLGANAEDMRKVQVFMSKWTQAEEVVGSQDKLTDKFMKKGRDLDIRTPMPAPAPMPGGRDDDDRKKDIEGGSDGPAEVVGGRLSQ